MKARGRKAAPKGRGARRSQVRGRAAAVHVVDITTALKRELDEAHERQLATSEVLRAIANSNGKLEPVFEAILSNALRICEAKFGNLQLVEADFVNIEVQKNAPKAYADWFI